MNENNQAILDALVGVLRLTRAGQFVVALELQDDGYVKITEYEGTEYDGRSFSSLINIRGDSGAAMIIDVITDLMY